MVQRFKFDTFAEGLAAGLWAGLRSPSVWALGAALGTLAVSVIYGR